MWVHEWCHLGLADDTGFPVETKSPAFEQLRRPNCHCLRAGQQVAPSPQESLASRAESRRPWLRNAARPERTGRVPRAGGARRGEQRRGLQLPRTRYTNNERATTGSARLRRLPICDVFLFIIGFLSSYRKTRGKYRETHLPLSLAP